jgi:hypothetical protein
VTSYRVTALILKEKYVEDDFAVEEAALDVELHDRYPVAVFEASNLAETVKRLNPAVDAAIAESVRAAGRTYSGPSEQLRKFRETAPAEEQFATMVSDRLEGVFYDFPETDKLVSRVEVEEESPLPIEEPPDELYELLVFVGSTVETGLAGVEGIVVHDSPLATSEWVTQEHLERAVRVSKEMLAAHISLQDEIDARLDEPEARAGG